MRPDPLDYAKPAAHHRLPWWLLPVALVGAVMVCVLLFNFHDHGVNVRAIRWTWWDLTGWFRGAPYPEHQ